MLKAFAFNHPDRLPIYYHASPAGLYVHGQKLLDLFREYPPDNPITFDAIPQPPAKHVFTLGPPLQTAWPRLVVYEAKHIHVRDPGSPSPYARLPARQIAHSRAPNWASYVFTASSVAGAKSLSIVALLRTWITCPCGIPENKTGPLAC
jgi:hypothetical protein